MGKSRIAAQMYTLRDFTKTPKEIEKTMKRVREIGYEAVQLSALGPIETEKLAGICRDLDLTVAATHVGFERMRDEMEDLVREHEILGCTYVAIGSLPADRRNAKGYARFAKEATEVAKRLKKSGLVFGYHNHSFELERYGGRTGLDILYEEAGEAVTAEIDTYWIQHGGGDPAAWIRKVSGRIPLVHLKDMGILGGKQIMTEVGEGNLNWQEILDACRKSGVLWYIVEQDTCQRDPFESLEISLTNLKGWGVV